MDWYKIPEIPFSEFVTSLRGIYDVLDEKYECTKDEDVFMKCILKHTRWKQVLKDRRFQKRLSMKLGRLHEDLPGLFPNYERLKPKHSSKCDVRSLDDVEYFEVKNKFNTMNSDSSKQVKLKLLKLYEQGKSPYLVLINCGTRIPKFGFPHTIQVINGKQFYHKLSGRDTFYNDLIDTLSYVFEHYKTYSELLYQ